MKNYPAIIAQNLTKRFGDFTAVNDVNFEVNPGEIFGFLGPNGSGKTTSIRMMLGLMKPTAGEVEVLNMNVNESASKIRPRVGYMSQQFSLYNDLSVMQNLHFYGAAYGLSNAELQPVSTMRWYEPGWKAAKMPRPKTYLVAGVSGWRSVLPSYIARK